MTGRVLNRLRSWLSRLVGPAWRLRQRRSETNRPAEPPFYTAVFVEDEPDAISPARVHFVGGEKPSYAAFACPCGCREVVRTNLLPEARPCWTWRVSPQGAVTLHPSVWRTTGCRSHFFVQGGCIVWCRDDGQASMRLR